MKFLMVGAGAIGGYFGGRLIENGEDVTFLVRKKRKRQLDDHGLVIKSVHGDFQGKVKSIITGEATVPYDVVILTVKAYHLDQAIADIKPYVGEETVIIPMLNGYRHFKILKEAYGEDRVVGGLCFIGTTLAENGTIVQISAIHNFVFGEWNLSKSDRLSRINEHLEKANFTSIVSDNIKNEIWNKYIFIAAMSGVTTLIRSSVGPILANENGRQMCKLLIKEIVSIIKGYDSQIDGNVEESTMLKLLSVEPSMKASMLHDMEKGGFVEADHFHGFLLQLAKEQGKPLEQFPLLQAVYANLKVYENSILS